MKLKILLFLPTTCMLYTHTAVALRLDPLEPLLRYTTKQECIASCSLTHCCTQGKTFITEATCPDGWSAGGGSTCTRAPTTTYNQTSHRYTTTTYTSCAATTETAIAWECTNYDGMQTTTLWTGCCVLDKFGTGCTAISVQ